jgi:hypothetical protein
MRNYPIDQYERSDLNSKKKCMVLIIFFLSIIMMKFSFAETVSSLNRVGVDRTGTVYAVANHNLDNLCGNNGRDVQIYLPRNFPNHDAAFSILMGAYLSGDPVWFSFEDVGRKCKILELNLDNR